MHTPRVPRPEGELTAPPPLTTTSGHQGTQLRVHVRICQNLPHRLKTEPRNTNPWLLNRVIQPTQRDVFEWTTPSALRVATSASETERETGSTPEFARKASVGSRMREH